MPQVAAAAVVAAITSGGFAAIATGATFATIAASAAIGALGAALAAGASMLLAGDPPSPGDFKVRQRTVMVREPTVPRRLVYGLTRTSGPLLYITTTNNQQYIHLIVALASHEVESIEEVWFDDQIAWTLAGGLQGRYTTTARVNVHLGATDQAADTDLVSEVAEWTSSHRLQGIAYVYVRLEFDGDIYPAGLPNISAVVKGKKVYDPRTTTTAYSSNAALCLRDYLAETSYGLAASATEIDDAAVITAANICDEAVSLNGGGSENRYEIHGIVDTSSTPQAVIEAMLASMAGYMIYSAGEFVMLAGAYRSPAVTITEDDLRGSLTVRTRRSRRDLYNAVKGVFVSAEDNYVEADFPPVISSTYATADGETRYREISLPFTQSPSMAQRIAKIKLLQSREQITVMAPCKLTALRVRPGDTIQLDNARMGWSGKTFEVQGFSFSIDSNGALGVDLALKETTSAVYSWSSSEEKDYLGGLSTSLPSAFSPGAPGLSLGDYLRATNANIVTILTADVTSSAGYQSSFEVEARLSGSATWVSMGQATANRFELANVADGETYEVRARVVNTLGVRSAWTQLSRLIVGKTAPPSDVTGFTINIVGTEAHLSWEAVGDVDLSHYKIRHSPLSTGASYSGSIDLVPKVARPATSVTVPALPGTYFIKAVDIIGISSTNASAAATNVDSIAGLNAVATTEQAPTFAGTKTNTVVDASALVLDTDVGGDYLSSGEYEFDNYVDLGAVFTARLSAALTVTRLEAGGILFDAAPGLFDAREGLFDGDLADFDDVNVELYVATTDDDPAGTPTWSAWRKFFVGDYTARAYKFKVILTTAATTATPRLTSLGVDVDMPDRVYAAADVVSGTDAGGKQVSFSPAFKAAPSIVVTPQDLAQGDYYEIVSKSASDCYVRFRNSGGSIVSRTFDLVAKGYGV